MAQSSTFDVIIVGAGPGGSACAWVLAQAGKKVALLDQATFPRDKICGDAISGKVLSVLKYMAPELLEILHQQEFLQPTEGIRFVAPNQVVLDIPLRSSPSTGELPPPAYVSTRLDFDNFLFQKAKALPSVEAFEGFRVKDVNRDSGQVTVSNGTQSLQAPVVVGADGAQSRVARSLAKHKIKPYHHSAGVRLYVEGVTGFHPGKYLELHYLKSLLPGYFWIFPLPNGRANVGLGMLTADLQKRPVNLREQLLSAIHTHPQIAPRFKDAQVLDDVKGFGLPLGSLKRTISGDRFLLVGDAAGLVDPFTGEGIGNAMISGRIAAQHILAGWEEQAFDSASLQKYDEAVFHKLGQELQLSHKLQQLARRPWLFNWVTKRVSKSPSMQQLFTMMFDNLDLRSKLKSPSFYLKLLSGR